MRNRKGQSILEYVIVLTVIVAAIAVFATQIMRPAVQDSLQRSRDAITNSTNRLGQVAN